MTVEEAQRRLEEIAGMMQRSAMSSDYDMEIRLTRIEDAVSELARILAMLASSGEVR